MSSVRLVAPLGQGAALQHWQRRARRLEMPHAVIVEGARGIGKTTVMRWLAASLLCPSDLDTDGPCGLCRTCSRIAADAFPDVHVVDRAKDETERKQFDKSFYVISVDQIRDARDVLLRQPVEGRARVLCMADADCMTEEAQNALLKTLEEPTPATFLLLEARRPEQLLSTVRSRSQRLRLVPLDDATLKSELAKLLPPHSASFDRAIRVARGSLGQAKLASTERAVQLHDLVSSLLETNKGLRPLSMARAVLGEAEDLREKLAAARTFLWLLRAELGHRIDALAAASPDSYPVALAEPWTTWLESTVLAERDLDVLIPPEQVLTACLVEFAGS